MYGEQLVSICIPSYNHSAYLKYSIESCLSQTYKNFEIIIVDDGSSDGSLQIAENYANIYQEKIRVYTHHDHKNRGIGATCNLAVQKSKGTLIYGFSSDDMMYPYTLEEHVSVLNKNPEVGFTCGYAQLIDSDGNSINKRIGYDPSIYSNLLEENIQRNLIVTPTVCYRRICIEKIGLQNEDLIYGDWEFVNRLIANFNICFIDRPLVKYRIHDCNTSIGISAEVDDKRKLEVLCEHLKRIHEIGGSFEKKRVQALLNLQISYYNFRLNNIEAAQRALHSGFEADNSLQHDHVYFLNWLFTRLQEAGEIDYALWLRRKLPQNIPQSFVKKITRKIIGLQLKRKAMDFQRQRLLCESRKMALQSLFYNPNYMVDRYFVSILIESLIGPKWLSSLKKINNLIKDMHD